MNNPDSHFRNNQQSDQQSSSFASSNYRQLRHPNNNKWRMIYSIAVLLTMLFGLASRRYDHILPIWLAAQMGDALWAGMIYWGLRVLTIPRSAILSLLGALLFSYGIECSQLYQADWINDIRATTLGALVLGHGFLVVDLFRYTVGALCMYIIDILIMKKQRIPF